MNKKPPSSANKIKMLHINISHIIVGESYRQGFLQRLEAVK
jgi:hypothetical protein